MRVYSLLLLGLWPSLGQSITQEEYVRTVLEKNKNLKALDVLSNAAKERERETDVLTATQLSASLSRFDKDWPSESASPTFSGSSGQSAQLILQKQTSFGLSGRLGVDLSQTSLHSFSFGPTQPPSDQKFANLTPSVELSQSLWQDAFGKMISIQRQILLNQSETAKSSAETQKRFFTMQAKNTYYRLAFAREHLRVSKEAVANAEKIYGLVDSKFKMNLTERSDLLQSKALLQSRKIALRSSELEEESASLAFNSLREIDSKEVQEALETFEELNLEASHSSPDVKNHPELVQMTKQLSLASNAVALANEGQKPKLEIFGSYSLLSRQGEVSKTVSKLRDPYQPANVIGLRLSLSLDRDAVAASTRAKKLEEAALRYQLDAKSEELKQTQSRLLSQLSATTSIYATSKDLVANQKEKLENEQKEFRNGRSTTYQLLMFTQDKTDAEEKQLQIAYQILLLHHQLALFEESKS